MIFPQRSNNYRLSGSIPNSSIHAKLEFQKMRVFVALLMCVPTLAMAKVISEQETTFTHKGKSLPATIKTIQRGDRTFEKMYIRVGPSTASCDPNDPKDCEAAIRDARRGGDR
ncbi:MAG: hypothetical protein AAFY75_16640 [Pseudomonadota bacterium]